MRTSWIKTVVVSVTIVSFTAAPVWAFPGFRAIRGMSKIASGGHALAKRSVGSALSTTRSAMNVAPSFRPAISQGAVGHALTNLKSGAIGNPLVARSSGASLLNRATGNSLTGKSLGSPLLKSNGKSLVSSLQSTSLSSKSLLGTSGGKSLVASSGGKPSLASSGGKSSLASLKNGSSLLNTIGNTGIANTSAIKNPFQGNRSALGNTGIAGGLKAATGSGGKPNLTSVASGMASSITPAGGLGTGTNVGPIVTIGGFGSPLPFGGGFFGGGLPFGGFGGGGFGAGMPAYSGTPQFVESDPAADAANQPIASTAATTDSQTTAANTLPLGTLGLSQPATSNSLPLGTPQLASAAANPTSNARDLKMQELNAPLDPNAANQAGTFTETTGGSTDVEGGTTTVNGGATITLGGTTDVTGRAIANGGTTTATGGVVTVQGGSTTIQGGTVTQNADGSQTVEGGTVTNTGGTVRIKDGTLENQGGQVLTTSPVKNQGGSVTTSGGTVVNQGGTVSNTGGTTTTGTVPAGTNTNANPNGTNPNAADPTGAVATGFPLPFGGFGGGLPFGSGFGGGGFSGPAMGGGISDPGIAADTPAAMADLAVTDIAVLDHGDPAQHLGPSYRITVVNNSVVPVNQPFDVMLLAGNTSQPSADLPSVSTRLLGLAPGQSTQVELRMLAGTSFSYLFPIVDNAQEVPDANPANNLATVAATPTQTR